MNKIPDCAVGVYRHTDYWPAAGTSGFKTTVGAEGEVCNVIRLASDCWTMRPLFESHEKMLETNVFIARMRTVSRRFSSIRAPFRKDSRPFEAIVGYGAGFDRSVLFG